MTLKYFVYSSSILDSSILSIGLVKFDLTKNIYKHRHSIDLGGISYVQKVYISSHSIGNWQMNV